MRNVIVDIREREAEPVTKLADIIQGVMRPRINRPVPLRTVIIQRDEVDGGSYSATVPTEYWHAMIAREIAAESYRLGDGEQIFASPQPEFITVTWVPRRNPLGLVVYALRFYPEAQTINLHAISHAAKVEMGIAE